MNPARANPRASATLLAAATLLWAAAALPAPRVRQAKKPPPPAATPNTAATRNDAEASPEPQPGTGEIAVTVVEVSGGQVYLKPGTAGGVGRGARVRIRGKEYTVVQATDSFAAVAAGATPPKEGDRGLATRTEDSTTHVVILEKPKPLTTWTEAWTPPVPPASTQAPRFVPLGGGERDRRLDVRLATSTTATLPLSTRGANLVRALLNARLHVQPSDAPLAFDLDFTVQHYFDSSTTERTGELARPTLFVRQLLGSYDSSGLYAGFGRMRYAASTLGMLDGARVSAPVGSGFAVGAFGGLLPHPMSGAPSLAATRFGVEATYNRDDLALRPDAALVVSGSTFDGRLDERRLSGVASVYPGDARLGAFFQLSAFDRGNPWNASALALTAAGLDASVHAGPMRFGARVDTRTPERSLWLASFLPVTWFCATAPAGGVERCEGKTPTLAQGLLDAGVDVGSFSLSAGVTRSVDLGLSGAPSAFGGFVASRVVRIADVLRLDATGHYSKATYMDIVGGSFGPGLGLLGDTLDVSAYYRGGTLRYSAMPELLVQHAVGGAVVVIPGPTLLFAFQGETLFGDDARALMLFGTATWRPRL